MVVSPVILPRLTWGNPTSPRRALLLHGLGSNGALMWRFGTALADAGWQATAVDLRGHGSAPRALDYTLAAYASDAADTRPKDDGAWDVVIGHSLGGAAATIAAASSPGWTRKLVLIDPGILLDAATRAAVVAGQAETFAHSSVAEIAAASPHWHPNDIELKSSATAEVSPWAVEQTGTQNDPWDAREAAAALRIPTHILAADPAVDALFAGDLAAEVSANPVISVEVIPGAGHSVHRDKPEETVRALLTFLA